MTAQVDVKNIGPIKHLQFELPEGGGVLVARGTHGAGKSTLVKAVGARLGGDTSGLTPTDGTRKGELTMRFDPDGPVAKLTVRASGRRTTGELVVSSLEGRFDISQLIDPGIKDHEACELARVKALVNLIGTVQLSPAELLESVGVPNEFVPEIAEGLPNHDGAIGLVAATKRELEKRAREWEKRAALVEQTVQSIIKRIGGYGALVGTFTIDQSQQMLDDISRREVSWRVEHELWAKQKIAIDQAKELLNTLPECEDVPALEARCAEGDKMVTAKTREVWQLRELLAKADEELATALQRQKDNAERLKDAVTLRQKREAVLEVIKPLDDEPQRPNFEFAYAKANEAMQLAVKRKELDDLHATRVAEEKNFKMTTSIARAWREAAKSCWSELFSRLKDNLGLRVHEDQLVLSTDRSEIEPYHELSRGERALVAIDVAVVSCKPPALLTLSQELWDGMNDDSRRRIAFHCKSRGCWMLTAEIGDGDLEVVEQPADVIEHGGTNLIGCMKGE